MLEDFIMYSIVTVELVAIVWLYSCSAFPCD